MIHKTEGIVLRTLKHQESNLITTLYTEAFGIRSFILTGFRSGKSRRKHSYFQPLSIVDIVFQERPGRSLHKVTESHISEMLPSLQAHPVKLSLGLAMAEIFYDTVKEEEAHPALYQLLRQTLSQLEQSDQRLIQWFLYFLVHLTGPLGFFPQDSSEASAQVRFDLGEGTLRSVNENGDRAAWLLRAFLYSELIPLPDPNSCQQLTFTQGEKRALIHMLFRYYQLHIEGFKYPQTMKVFAEVFGG
ncbi:MAG: DNA repair protein RecO [Bacteroidota bacterium]